MDWNLLLTTDCAKKLCISFTLLFHVICCQETASNNLESQKQWLSWCTSVFQNPFLIFLEKLQTGLVKEWFNHQNNWNSGTLNLDWHSLLLVTFASDSWCLYSIKYDICISLMDCYSVPKETMRGTVANWFCVCSRFDICTYGLPKTSAFYDFKNLWFLSQTHDALLHYEYLKCR